MELLRAIYDMFKMPDPQGDQVADLLENGKHIITANRNKRGDNMLRYDFHIRDNILYTCKMSDSSRDQIILTPEGVQIYDRDMFLAMWDESISKEDVIIVDVPGHMKTAKYRMGQEWSHEKIKSALREKSLFIFQDPYSEE